ncbi:MAG TPA: hypothetical protein VHO95_05030 [Candidatus Dormibacteraeota bacterium]|jgi:hypothetical protein|nr:hypothetical protein [Candidatus Dormibacteraeota bacterium]
MTTSSTRWLAVTLGAAGAASSVFTFGFVVASGIADQVPTLFLADLTALLMAVLGAMIAARQPRNGIGWLMIATAFATALVSLPTAYAFTALVTRHGGWPWGEIVLWFGTWSSPLVFSLLLPLIISRFPDGKVRPRWSVVDWLAIIGTLCFGGSLFMAASSTPLASVRVDMLLAPYSHSPFGALLPNSVDNELWMTGLAIVIAAYVSAAFSLAARFRSASPVENIQLKWFAYSGVLLAATTVYAGVAWWFGQVLSDALVPFVVGVVTLPLAIGIAILRYRLFDIDLIIDRSLVYGGVTAILYAAYVAFTTFLQRLFISVSGQKSDAAYVLTAFIVIGAFNPVKDWLQRLVGRRERRSTTPAALERFGAEVDAVISIMDVRRVACRFVDQAVLALDAGGADLYLDAIDATTPFYSRGKVNGDAALQVALRHDERRMGRLVLADKRRGGTYSQHDIAALQKSADSVGEALALAEHYGVATQGSW